jgi:hypothetical protein
MPRATKLTPADELAAVDEQIDELVREGEALSARQGEAEAMIRSYPDRRENAVVLVKLGEDVDVPDEAEQARLQRFVANAKVEHDAIGRARRQREEERDRVIARSLPHFDCEAEAAARALEAEGEELLSKLSNFHARMQAKGEAWRRSREGRRELGLDQMPGVGYHDLAHLRGEIADAVRTAWPANSEERWREFKAAEQSPPGARLGNAAAVRQFEGRAA